MTHRVHRVIRQREQDTARERDRLQQFLSGIDASPNGVMMIDGSEHITWISSVAALHFGLDPVRDLAQRVTNLVRTACNSSDTSRDAIIGGRFSVAFKQGMQSRGRVDYRVSLTPSVNGSKNPPAELITTSSHKRPIHWNLRAGSWLCLETLHPTAQF